MATDGAWHSIEELDEKIDQEPNVVYQVGFFYKETDEYPPLPVT